MAEAWHLDVKARIVLVFRRSSAGSETFDVRTELSVEGELTSPLLPGFALRVGEIFER